MHQLQVLATLAACGGAMPGGDWISVGNETASRLVADAALVADDPDEKDYAWGDLDQDGDLDLVIVRKTPFTTPGRRVNVLLLNENGVLVDRTAAYASESDVPGDQGFLTPTNDRDVILVDVNADGWLDLVTATTLSDDQPKHIGHPRVYVNRGERNGAWLGLRFENDRIPQLVTDDGTPVNPRFNAVAAGDVSGNGAPDLYFCDSDLGGPSPGDLNDRLLANDGNGYFVDVSNDFMTDAMRESVLAGAAAIVDMNADGHADVVRCDAIFGARVTIAYNQANGPGGFDVLETVYTNSPTYISVADINLDGLPDILVTDDASDRILANQGNGGDGLANFLQVVLENSVQFGGQSVVEDLDTDGLPDIVIADVHIEIPGCNRTAMFYRHEGVVPAVGFADDPPGGMDEADRQGTFDVAAFDISGDGRPDLVVGRCTGTQIWIQDSALGDLNSDGVVGIIDLLELLASWGPCPGCSADLDVSGTVNIIDLLMLLENWTGS